MRGRSITGLDELFFLGLLSVPTVLLLHYVASWVSSVFSASIFR
jgi:hypothetical protein